MNPEHLPVTSETGQAFPLPQQYGHRNANPLGAASVAVAAIGLAICFGGALLGLIQQQRRIAKSDHIARTRYEPSDPTVIVDHASVGLTFISQLAIYGVCALIGGTFSLVAFALGVAGLPTQPNRIAIIGIVVSPIGPLLLLVCFLLL